MPLRNRIKELWSKTSKNVKFSFLSLIIFSIYAIIILTFFPKRYYRSGYYLAGLSGWEFGLFLVLFYILLSLIFIESPFLSEELHEKFTKPNFSYKNLIWLNIFVFISFYFLLFATQLIENLISIYKCQSRTGSICNKDTTGWMLFYNIFANMGIEHNDILYFIWTFSGLLFIMSFIFFGIAVDYAKRKGIFDPPGFNAFNYIFWINIFLGSTGWMYIAWFSLTDFDLKMWLALKNGETWGYFSIGFIGVFFNSIPELIFMISVSCSLFFINFYVLNIYFEKIRRKYNN
ncbi:MAG: hypothetical protein ACTSQJ_13050 [Promethearchaeota archaeon]